MVLRLNDCRTKLCHGIPCRIATPGKSQIRTLEFLPVSLNWSTKSQGRQLLGAMLVQKSENVFGPDVGSKVAKGMPVSRGVAVGGINL